MLTDPRNTVSSLLAWVAGERSMAVRESYISIARGLASGPESQHDSIRSQMGAEI